MWPYELQIWTTMLRCGPLSSRYVLTRFSLAFSVRSCRYGLPHFSVAPPVEDMDSQPSAWPRELQMDSHISVCPRHGLPRFGVALSVFWIRMLSGPVREISPEGSLEE